MLRRGAQPQSLGPARAPATLLLHVPPTSHLRFGPSSIENGVWTTQKFWVVQTPFSIEGCPIVIIKAQIFCGTILAYKISFKDLKSSKGTCVKHTEQSLKIPLNEGHQLQVLSSLKPLFGSNSLLLKHPCSHRQTPELQRVSSLQPLRWRQ